MKPLKKEAKIVIGISATIFLLAIIALIVVLAVMESKKGAVLFDRKYTYIQTEDDKVIVRDNLFIAGVDGGMVLVNENSILSKKYVSLKIVNEKEKLFEFTTHDGEYGIIDRNGKEITKVKTNGNFINDIAKMKSFNFTYDIIKNKTIVSLNELTSNSYDKVYLYSDNGSNNIPSINQPILSEKTKPGAFIFSNASSQKKYLTSIYNQNITLDTTTIIAAGDSYVSCVDAGVYKTYALPRLDEVVELQKIHPNKVLFYENEGNLLKFAVVSGNAPNYVSAIYYDGNKYDAKTIIKPTSIKASHGDATLLLLQDGTVALTRKDSVKIGQFKKMGELYKIGESLFSENLDVLNIDSTSDLDTFIATDEGVEYYHISKNLYTYKNGELVKILDNCETTYGDINFSDELKTEGVEIIYDYDVLFTSGDTVYDKNLKKLKPSGANIRAVNKNLLQSGSTYFDYTGKKRIDDVETVYPIYDCENELIEDYVFVKTNGDYCTYDNKLTSKAYLSANGLQPFNSKLAGIDGVIAYQLSDNVTIFNTDLGIICGDTLIDTTKYQKMSFIGKDMLALEAFNSIDIFKVTKKSMALVNSISANGIKIVDSEREVGVIFKDNLDMYGFIGTNGKQVMDKIYDGMSFIADNLLVSKNTLGAIYNMNGGAITDFKYMYNMLGISAYLELGSHTLLLTTTGSYEVVNGKGDVVIKGNLIGTVDVINLVSHHSGKYVISEAYDYYFVFSDGVYRVIKEAK